MIRNITCGKRCADGSTCKQNLGWFDTATGCIKNEDPKDTRKVFGAYLFCKNCKSSYQFDGLRARKKFLDSQKKQQREQQRQQSAPLFRTVGLGFLAIAPAA